MKFCGAHWEELRTAVRDAGLDRFIAKGGEEVVTRLVRDDPTRKPAENFEPLLGAWSAITVRALETAGLGVMQPGANGEETCPLCFLISGCPCGETTCGYRRWIPGAVGAQVERARELGLLPVPS